MKTQYQCQKCGNCCRWEGYVRLLKNEPKRIAEFLNMTEAAFVKKYTNLDDSRKYLVLKSRKNHECVLFDGKGCIAHPVKPKQCVDFPNKWSFKEWREGLNGAGGCKAREIKKVKK